MVARFRVLGFKHICSPYVSLRGADNDATELGVIGFDKILDVAKGMQRRGVYMLEE